MKKTLLLALAIAAALLWSGFAGQRAQAHHRSMTISTDDHAPITNCSQIEISYDHREAIRDEQDFTLTKSQVLRLVVRPSHNGGISVLGSDRQDYSIKACKAAAGPDSKHLLSQIAVSIDAGSISVHGPDSEEDWVVYLILQVPRNPAPLDLETENGEINLHEISGQISARTENGPIELVQCAGVIRARAQNGPIDFTGSAGDLRLDAQNGPITVKLTGEKWDGAGLEARTENGPLTLHVPDGYISGIHVEATGYSPFSCEARACDDAHGTWRREHHSVDMGSGTPVVRMATVNGPVEIESASARD
jgi:DUF4097 and DUF4098 domain-containing protein YvlB